MTISKNIKWLVCTVFIIIIALVAYYYYPSSSVALPTTTVKRGDIKKQVTIPGTVIPKRQNTIMAGYDGYVKKLYVKLRQQVKPGDNLVSITDTLQSKERVYPIKASFAGVVVLINKSEGEHVSTIDKDAILEVDDLSEMFINANVPENSIPGIKVGQKAIIKLTPLFDKTYHGIVETISLAAKKQQNMFDSTQAVFPVRIKILDKDSAVLSGMSAKIDITTAQKKNVLVLPHQFINHNEKYKDFVTLSDGSIRKVTLGLQDDANAEIKSGLKLGERVRQVNYMQKVDGSS